MTDWKIKSSNTVFKNRVHLVEYDVILPDGTESKYIVDEAPASVAILLEFKPKTFLFSYQYRFPLRSWIYDIIGGAVDPGETIKAAAVRETEEETGLVPKNLKVLGSYFANPGRSTSIAHSFFCKEFSEGKRLVDSSEHIKNVEVYYDDVEKMIQGGIIKDPGILIAWSQAKAKNFIL